MKLRKLVALMAMLAVLCTAFSGLTLVKAESYELVTEFESSVSCSYKFNAVNDYREANQMVLYNSGFDATVDCYNPPNATETEIDYIDGYINKDGNKVKDWYQTAIYEKHTAQEHADNDYTNTNQYGTEVVVNKNGIVIDVESTYGNNLIPKDGYVVSGNGTASSWLQNNVKVGYAAFIHEGTVYFYRTSADSDFTHVDKSCELKKSALYGGDVALPGEDSPTTTYNTDVLVKLVNSSITAGSYNKGYVVKYGGNFGTTDIPSGYIVLPLIGQSLVDNESTNTMEPSHSASYAFEQYGAVGALVNLKLDANKNLDSSVYFRFDIAAAMRQALLLTGLGGEVIVGSAEGNTVEKVTIAEGEFQDSAKAILDDAKTYYRVVDIAQMEAYYNQMKACAETMLEKFNNNEFESQESIEAYHVTIKQLYKKIYDLSFEQRPVEMRATWWTPMERKDDNYKSYTAEDWDNHLTTEIRRIKDLGYNMIFVETLFNSTVIFPNSPAYDGVAYQQNPYLVPDEMGGLNTALTSRYDMLQKIIEICKANDIEPHIQWMTCYVAYRRIQENSDDLFEYSIVDNYFRQNPTKYGKWLNKSLQTNDADENDSYQVPNTTTYQYFLNPQNEDARQFVLTTLKHIMQTYDVGSIQLDYCRYPAANSNNSGFGFDSETLTAFKQSTYYDSNTHTDEYMNSTAMVGDLKWAQFRANYVTQWVKGVYDYRNANHPNLYITASPDPDPDHAIEDVQQDVRTWLSKGYIDILFPMAYGQNVPGHVAPIVTTANPNKFVCIGTDNDYFSKEYEMRWMRESRAAGADGIASFCESEMYKDDLWKDPAITPTGDATKAAMTYLQQVVAARVDKMVALGDVDEDQEVALTAAIDDAAETIRLYGIEADEVETALDALQNVANDIGGNPQTAITNDVTYLKKIKNNARDNAKETAGVTVDPNSDFKVGKDSLTANNDNNSPIRYTASTKVLIVKDSVTLSGTAPEGFEIYVEGGEKTVHLNALKIGDTTLKVIAGDNMNEVTVRLSGETVMSSADFLDNAKYIYGVGTIVDNSGKTLRVQGDVDGDDSLYTNDVRQILCANVGKVTLDDTQKAFADANGDRKINTTDARLFLEKSLGKIA